MKKLPLHGKHGVGKYTIVSDEDYENLIKYRWIMSRNIKNNHLCYAFRAEYQKNPFKAKHIYLHRIIQGDKRGYYVDHINRDTLDNRRENLRWLTPSDSNRNRDKFHQKKKRRSVDSPTFGKGRGYVKDRNRFKAVVRGKYYGSYATREEAKAVYLKQVNIIFRLEGK